MALLSFVGSYELVIILFSLLFIVVLPILALVSVLRSQFEGNDKIIWILLIVFLPCLGSMLYFVLGKKKRVAQKN